MNKIIVTETQGEMIEAVFAERSTKLNKFAMLTSRLNNFNYIEIARIIEGESYEIKRKFKVGDVVQSSNTKFIYIVTDDKKSALLDQYIYIDEDSTTDHFTLICKAEDRQDSQRSEQNEMQS